MLFHEVFPNKFVLGDPAGWTYFTGLVGASRAVYHVLGNVGCRTRLPTSSAADYSVHPMHPIVVRKMRWEFERMDLLS